jgi:hypothetical protein
VLAFFFPGAGSVETQRQTMAASQSTAIPTFLPAFWRRMTIIVKNASIITADTEFLFSSPPSPYATANSKERAYQILDAHKAKDTYRWENHGLKL